MEVTVCKGKQRGGNEPGRRGERRWREKERTRRCGGMIFESTSRRGFFSKADGRFVPEKWNETISSVSEFSEISMTFLFLRHLNDSIEI